MPTLIRWVLIFSLIVPTLGYAQSSSAGTSQQGEPPQKGEPPANVSPGPGVVGPIPPERMDNATKPNPKLDANDQGKAAIVPLNVDPAMNKSPPATESQMPVIQPPVTNDKPGK